MCVSARLISKQFVSFLWLLSLGLNRKSDSLPDIRMDFIRAGSRPNKKRVDNPNWLQLLSPQVLSSFINVCK